MRSRAKILLLSGIASAALLCAGTGQAQPSAPAERATAVPADSDAAQDATFAEFVSALPAQYLAITPELATLYGIDEGVAGPMASEALSDYGPQGVASAGQSTLEIYTALNRFDPARLNSANRLTYAVVHTEMKNAIDVSQTVSYGRLSPGFFRTYQIDQFIGAHILLLNLMTSAQPASTAREADAFLIRLDGIPKALSDLSQAIEMDAAKGVVPPDFVLDKVIASITTAVVPAPKDNAIIVALRSKLAEHDLDADGRFAARAEEIVGDQLYPAFRDLRATLERLRKTAPHDAGIWRLPNGPALYQALIKQQSNTDLSGEEIHALGLADVDRILGEMDAILVEQNYRKGSVADRMRALAVNPRFLYPPTPEGKAAVIDVLNQQMRDISARLDDWFGVKPTHGVEVRMVPAYQEATASSASYDPPALDGSRPGTYWINLRDMKNLPIWSVKSDTFHEVVPGHHLQTSIALGQGETPLIRNLLVNSPFSEGWALYAELLAKEMGMYSDDPFGDLGRLRWELHRAVRLVVDTGMHAKKWSREQAIAYSAETTGMDIDSIEQEVERYAVIPGQALSYKIGMFKILELRDRAKAALGPKFDIRTFHDAILVNGPMPLDVLEQQIDAWIADQK